ncbi:hypothetical protein S4054249_24960 [Pseudoalteromonas luteoviolacea]|uniref:DUF637 domain-containing protein n=3 Tax=Pseudoalteromonas luteoviolacea TaxID=43657 RepID=A0A0F6A546_9GAMM|nr:hypothetical protein S4054249_24960 [Pseudoalteromonas luteoviolacea]AOT15749.1 hypothetical protein S40542_23550 [Pseudoalteromonas luteoviolacea]AOT20908.1 hypothetical protein S4054_24880 [Pseudoalteromonas luteoviolacea]KKE80976.1 hypothetical protein N479_24010 [Pseudoalteromonas luteoviolacea S4054]KZN74563.1 hypothetical protein N481_09065 [Pseudoalteromonas luteoviolacea S4047-1]
MENIKRSFWHKATSYGMAFFMMLQLTLPSVASAMTSVSSGQVEHDLTSEQMFIRSVVSDYLYQRSSYIPKPSSSYGNQSIAEFHSKLKTSAIYRLPNVMETDYIPIVGNITIIIPQERTTYPLQKQVGDSFVQKKLIGEQIKRLIGRTYYKDTFTSEEQQINQLYVNAMTVAKRTSFTNMFGAQLPSNIADTLNIDFIWPESRKIGGHYVLVPVVHLRTSVVNSQSIDGTHTVEFRKSNASFKSATISNADLKIQRDASFSTINDLVIGSKSSITLSKDASKIYAGVSYMDDGHGNIKGVASGTLFNYGQINAARNVSIVAGNYEQKTLAHRFKTPHGYEDHLGRVASINAGGGISIQTFNDIELVGAQLNANGGSIILTADGNIKIGSTPLKHSSEFKVGQYDKKKEGISYYQSVLSASDTIQLLAKGELEISGAEFLADTGLIELMGANGVTIVNDVNRESYNASDSQGSSTDIIQELKSIAVTAALDAGKGVIIRSPLGDIKLQGVQIHSQDGANISAESGKVELLLAQDTYQYYRHSKQENFWRIKTRTVDEQRERPIYNTITGGVEINAAQGIELELAKIDGQPDPSLYTLKQEFNKHQGLKWMKTLAEKSSLRCPAVPNNTLDYGYLSDGSYNLYKELQLKRQTCLNESTVDIAFKALKDHRTVDTTRSLTPAAMAVIAIAVSVAMGPGGFELVGTSGAKLSATAIGKSITAVVGQKAFAAGVISIATQAASSLAIGRGLDGTVKDLLSSDGIRATATAVVTAGLGEYFLPEIALNTNYDIVNQIGDAIVRSTMNATVNWAIQGGSLSELDNQIIAGVKSFAVQRLGQTFVNKIDSTLNVVDGSTTEIAMNYVAHAFSGCVLGIAALEANSTPEHDRAKTCAINAGATVAGRYIGVKRAQAEQTVREFKDFEREYNSTYDRYRQDVYNVGLELGEIGAITNMAAEGMTQQFLNQYGSTELIRLYAALLAFVSGAGPEYINLASTTVATNADAASRVALAHLMIGKTWDILSARASFNGDSSHMSGSNAFNEVVADFAKDIKAKQKQSANPHLTAEEYKAAIIENLSKHYSPTEIKQIEEMVDLDTRVKELEKVTYDLAKLGGTWGCTESGNRCVTEYYFNIGDYGLLNKLSQAKTLDAHAAGTDNKESVTNAQRLLADMVIAVQPVGQPIDEIASGFVAEYGDQLDAASGALMVIDMLRAPIWSVAKLIINETPLKQRYDEAISAAHTQAVVYVAKGDETLQPGDVSSTLSGMLIAGEVAVSVATLPKTVRDLNVSKAMFQNEGMVVLREFPRPCGVGLRSASQYSAFDSYGSTYEESYQESYPAELDPYQVTAYSAYTPMSSGCNANIKNVETPSGTFIRFDENNKAASWEEFKALNPNTSLKPDDFYDYAFEQKKVFNPDTKRFVNVVDGKKITKTPSHLVKPQSFSMIDMNVTNKSVTDRDGTTHTYQQVSDAKRRIETRKEEIKQLYPDTYTQNAEYKSLLNEGRKYSERGGTIAGKAAMEHIGNEKNANVRSILAEYPDGTLNSNFDDIIEIEISGVKTYAVIENKGGSAILGTRNAKDAQGNPINAQQGTKEYHYSLLKSMEAKLARLKDDPRRASDPAFNNGYEKVLEMYKTIKHKPVEFYHVSQTYDAYGNPAEIKINRHPDIPGKK